MGSQCRDSSKGVMLSDFFFKDKSCRADLDMLQAMKGGIWDASQKQIAIIQAREDERDD